MAVDYLTIGLSVVIFILYLVIFFILIEIKKKLNKDSGRAFIYLMVATFVLVVRRLWEILVDSEIFLPISNLTDLASLIFALLFFFGMLTFYKSLKKVSSKRRNLQENYKKIIGRI